MQEEIGYAAMTEIPCVIVDAQRAGPGTGIATKSMQGDVYQVRYGRQRGYSINRPCPQFAAGDVDLTIAFNYAEKYRTPVFLLADESSATWRTGHDPRGAGPSQSREKNRKYRRPICSFRAETPDGVPPIALLRRRLCAADLPSFGPVRDRQAHHGL